jgi:hypothetical protein
VSIREMLPGSMNSAIMIKPALQHYFRQIRCGQHQTFSAGKNTSDEMSELGSQPRRVQATCTNQERESGGA